MTKISKDIYFFTDTTDTSFILNDIQSFAATYNRVAVYTFQSLNKEVFPENVSIKLVDFKAYNTKKILKKYFSLILYTAVVELIKYPNYIIRPRYLAQAVSSFMRNSYLAEIIDTDIRSSVTEKVFFTFWFNGWATALAVLKRNKVITSFYSRIHGTDLYEYRIPVTQRIPFRWFQLQYADGVFSVSKKGASYLKEKYSKYQEKIGVNYLGVAGYSLTKLEAGDYFTLVSCSIMDVIKRVYLIPEILKYIDFPVRWVHFGEKVESDPTRQLFLKNIENLNQHHKNIKVDLMGFTPNKNVLEFYKTTSVNLFISVSESEGLPVSMMESIGFGIPVMATDVGGCSEIVNDQTGILIPKNFDAFKVAEQLKEFMKSAKNSDNFRMGANRFCDENFNRKTNFEKLNVLMHQLASKRDE
ncbi:hypothetical protein CNR22_06955 [Sphingobacteriaceae bacterium]|nr:hypothetical protein CNR22_06955 [Sphingobacteriaceae bacterium]